MKSFFIYYIFLEVHILFHLYVQHDSKNHCQCPSNGSEQMQPETNKDNPFSKDWKTWEGQNQETAQK